MSRKLRETERKLLHLLQRFEQEGREFGLDEVVAATGYKLASVKTYFSKKLENALVEPTEDGLWRARGALRLDEDDFARLMSQNAAEDQIPTEAEWRAAMQRLIAIGKQRGYSL